jgi:transposase-like protein
MDINEIQPKSLIEAVRYFSDLNVCHAYMAKLKWPDGVPTCPNCGTAKVGFIASRRMYQCKNQDCRKQFSVKVGTIFEDSPLGLEKWFVAVWSITNAKNGISSCELARALDVTQKTAWFMLHRVRLAMKSKFFPKMGRNGTPVEADETYIGGLAKNMHAKKRAEKITGSGSKDKTAVMGLLERHTSKKHSTVRTEVLPKHPTAEDMHRIIHKNVEPGAHLMTDELQTYKHLYTDFEHQFIDHATRYAEGIVHTNGMENYWSLFKRIYKGTYIKMAPEHLHRYLDEQAMRFNERTLDDGGRFRVVMPGVVGRRIMYKELIGALQ